MKIAHLSDPHFGTTSEEVRIAIRSSLAILKPDLILITGDITQRAREAQFSEARNFIKSLEPIETLAVPGNHDIALFNFFARIFRPHHLFTRYISSDLNPFYENGNVAVAMLNTALAKHHIDGEMKTEELQKQLSKFHNAHLFRILAFHHPMDCPTPSDEKNLILNALDVAEIASQFQIDLVLGGHIHNPITRLSTARYPALARPFIVSVAGTCLSLRTRPPCSNAFTLIETPTDGKELCHVSRYEYAKTERFEATMLQKYRRILGIWTEE